MSAGYLGHMGLKEETAFGAEAAPPEVFGEFFNESIVMDNRLIRPATVNGSRFRKWVFPGPVSGRGGISTALAAEGIVPRLLKGLFGSVSTEELDTGVYEHTFVPVQSSSLPSFTVQLDQEGGCQNWIGSTVAGATMSVAPGDILGFSVDLLAQRPKRAEPSAPAYPGIKPWIAFEAVFTLNGVENVNFEDFTLSFANSVEPVWTLNGQRHATRHVAKGFELEGSIAVEFDSDEQRRRMWGSAGAAGPELTI